MTRKDTPSDRELAEALRALESLCCVVPKRHSTWSYQRTTEYKDAYVAASAVIRMKRHSLAKIEDAIRTMKPFHKAE